MYIEILMMLSYIFYFILLILDTINVLGINRDIDDNCEQWAIAGECNTSPG